MNKNLSFAFSIVLVIAGGLGCSHRDLYKDSTYKEAPIKRSYVYTSRTEIQEAGAEPVESGGVLVTEDNVFIASETQGLEAFNRYTFSRKWRLPIKNGISSQLLLHGQTIYFGANNGVFYAVDAEFGHIRWQYTTKAPVYAKPTISNHKIYLTASNDIIYCLDQNTGKWIWHYKRSVDFVTTVFGNSSPTIEGNRVYVGFSDGYLTSLNSNDGNIQWEAKIHSGTKFTDVDAKPVIDETRIYVPSYDGSLYALNKSDGKVLWHVDIGGSKQVILDEKNLLLASSDGNIYSLNKNSGKVNWKFELDLGTPTKIALKGQYILFGSSQKYFYAIYKGDGSLAFRYSVGLRSGFSSEPVVAGKELYIMSNFGNLYVFKLNKG